MRISGSASLGVRLVAFAKSIPSRARLVQANLCIFQFFRNLLRLSRFVCGQPDSWNQLLGWTDAGDAEVEEG